MKRPFQLLSDRSLIDLKTADRYPPIPYRHMDWSAIDDNTYDVGCDERGYFSTSPHGIGPTELAAIDDLLDQIEDGRKTSSGC